MAKRMITCYGCGNRYNANETQMYYDKKHHKYYCSKCYNEKKREIDNKVRELRKQQTGMRQTIPEMILKIIGGLGIIILFFDMEGGILLVIIGVIVMLSGILPFVFRTKKKEES